MSRVRGPRIKQPAERADPSEMRDRRRAAAGLIARRVPPEEAVLALMAEKYGLKRNDALALLATVRTELMGDKLSTEEERRLQLARLHSMSDEARALKKPSAAVSAEGLIADLLGTRQPLVIRTEGPAAERERLVAVLMRFDETTVKALLSGERHVALGHAGHADVGAKSGKA